MRKSIKMFIPLLLTVSVFFTGCLVTSIHPLGTEDDFVFDDNLIGTWTDNDDELWIFSKKDENTYNLILLVEDHKGDFNAKLVNLEGKLFLDIFPERLDTGNIVTDVLMLPTHTFMKYSLEGSELSLGLTDLEWFKDRIERNEDVGIQYEITEDDVIMLTASTEELQAFYLKHADDSEFFDFDDEKLLKEMKIMKPKLEVQF